MEKEKINFQVLSHIKVENHIEYLINITNKKSGINIFFTDKYQNLRSLYEKMKKESKIKNFPSFPPNKLFGYEEENFVIQRAKDLNSFFTEIMSDNNFSKIPSFKDYIASNVKKNSILKKDPIKKDENKPQKEDNKNISKKKANKLKNSKFDKRAKLFNNFFFTMEKDDINNFHENKKEMEDIKNKFVSIYYEIEIISNQKTEKKYKTFFDNNNNFNIDINKNININNGDDKNFDLIGKSNGNIEKTEKNINIYKEKNLEKFKSLRKLVELENFFLK